MTSLGCSALWPHQEAVRCDLTRMQCCDLTMKRAGDPVASLMMGTVRLVSSRRCRLHPVEGPEQSSDTATYSSPADRQAATSDTQLPGTDEPKIVAARIIGKSLNTSDYYVICNTADCTEDIV